MLILRLISILVLALVSFAEDRVIYRDDNSIAYKNTLQVHEFLVHGAQDQAAVDLTHLLDEEDLYWMPYKNDEGEVEEKEGFTFSTAYVEIRDDFVKRDYLFDMDDRKSVEGFKMGAAYANVLIHELIHYHDYKNAITSPEKSTYYRSMVAYRNILVTYLMEKYRRHGQLGSPEAAYWLARVRAYASLLHGEFTTYDNEEHGEITGGFTPVWDHKGCVKKLMNHNEFGKYLNGLSTHLNSAVSYDDNMKKFDLWARYKFPNESNASCITNSTPIAPISKTLPVGHKGPRQRQRIFEIQGMEKGNYLRIVKKNKDTQDAKINFEAYSEDQNVPTNQFPKKLLLIGRVNAWQKDATIFYNKKQELSWLVISELVEDSFPQKLDFQMTRVWYDENQNRHEGPLVFKEFKDHEQSRYGYFPIHEVIARPEFTIKSPNNKSQRDYKAMGFKFEMLNKDFLRLAAPEINERNIELYKLEKEDSSKPHRPLKYVSTLYYFKKSTDIRIQESGTYYLFFVRDKKHKTNKKFEASLQFSRWGKINPSQIKLTPLTPAEYAEVGYHLPYEMNLEFSLNPETSPLGIGSYRNAFLPSAMLKVNLRKGDFFNFSRLPGWDKRTGELSFFVMDNGKLKREHYFPYWYKEGSYRIANEGLHYLGVSTKDEHFRSQIKYHINFEIYRRSRQGGKEVQFLPMTKTELEGLGFYSRFFKKMEGFELTSGHPKAFVSFKGAFQHFRITVKNKIRLHIRRNNDEANDLKYTWSKVDPELWGQNKASMVDFKRWSRGISSGLIDLEAGVYYLTLESDLEKDAAGIEKSIKLPFEIKGTSIGADPKLTKVETLTPEEMRDARYRLVPF